MLHLVRSWQITDTGQVKFQRVCVGFFCSLRHHLLAPPSIRFYLLSQVTVICTSPDGVFIMAIDEDGRSLLINKKQSVLLHRFSFKGPVKAAEFSPDGRFIACAVGRILQVALSPTRELSYLSS